MTYGPISCNECGTKMPKRQEKQLIEPLPAFPIPGACRKRRFFVQWLVTGVDFETRLVAAVGIDGKAAQPNPQDFVITTPEEFDICETCQAKHMREALEQIEKRLAI